MELFKIGFVSVRLIDVIDIGIVTFLFYKAYELLKGSLGFRILSAVLLVFLLWKLVALLDLVLLKSILDQFLGAGAVALIVIFAPEIRRFLVIVGKNTFIDRLLATGSLGVEATTLIGELLEGIEQCRNSKLGALIVLAGRDNLERIQETGDQLNASISARLLQSIFLTTGPLHDGAVVIVKGRIAAARCVLPITEKPEFPPELGMRHRAAMGLGEATDAMIIIVSEETNKISIVHDGKLDRDLDLMNTERLIRKHYEMEEKK
ncbi:MAG: diadenylate cyclase [Bacteroidia bacterium]|nr:diadenylate cyclase [Bacteroidia bacterium]